MYCGKKSISGAFELIDSRWRSTAPTAHSEAQRATSVCARSVHEFPPSPLSTVRLEALPARRRGSLARASPAGPAPRCSAFFIHRTFVHITTVPGTSSFNYRY